MNNVILKTVQELSGLKYFYRETVEIVFKSQLERAKLIPTDKQRKAGLKKLYVTLSRLGYRVHVGEEQTVPIVRSL